MSNWDKMDRSTVPTMEDISAYVRNPVCEELSEFIIDTYKVKPVFEYSRCSWPGWNVKFKKSGKSLCTFYPYEGYLGVLVVIGQKEKERFERELPMMGSYMRKLYEETKEGMGQRWLLIELEDPDMLEDVKHCIHIRRYPDGSI